MSNLKHPPRLGSALVAVALFLALNASAHTGHPLGDATVRHLLMSADHWPPLAAAGAVLLLIARLVHALPVRRAMQLAGLAGLTVGTAGWLFTS